MKKIDKAEVDLRLAIIARDLLYEHLEAHNAVYKRMHKKLSLLLKVVQENCDLNIIEELNDVIAHSKEEAAEYKDHMREQLDDANRVIIKADANKS